MNMQKFLSVASLYFKILTVLLIGSNFSEASQLFNVIAAV